MFVGLLHPGQMGVTVAQSLLDNGHEVAWVAQQRSDASRARARAAGLQAAPDLAVLVASADVLVSVCPPAAALELAQSVKQLQFAGWYLDANAIAPATAAQIAELFGDQYIDGGIIGPPAIQAGTTRLYLSGANAEAASRWFHAGNLDAIALPLGVCAASALKMAYASYTKGHSALLLAAVAAAHQQGVGDYLQREFEHSQPGVAKRLPATAAAVAPKAWRFAGEMEQIAQTYAEAGLPDELHLAIAELYRRMAPLQHEAEPNLAKVLEKLLRQAKQHG